MFVDIITRAPKPLTYQVLPPLSSKIKVGQIILVPLGNQKVKGVVWSINKKGPSIKTKTVEKILTLEPLFWPYQIELANFVAEYYATPLCKIVNLFLPPKIPTGNPSTILNKNKRKSLPPLFLWTDDEKRKEKIFFQEIKKCLKAGQQIIILYPQLSFDSSFLHYLYSWSPPKVTLLEAKKSASELTTEWEAIRSGQRKIIIGSQKPLFMPYPSLGLIIVEDEQNSLYKQERAPRYHTSWVAQQLARFSGAKIILSSSLPSINTYYQIQMKNYKLTRPQLIKKPQKPKIILVDLNKFPYEERIISPPLKELINEALGDKQQIILFLNRKGFARYLICPDCRLVINCPSCNLPLIYYANHKPYLWCPRCRRKEEVPETCPRCSSLFITERGLGIGKVKNWLKKFYPLTRIELLDKEVTKPKIDKIILDFLAHKINIIVGTQIILNYPNLVAPFLGIISADTELYLPDFEAEQKTFYLISSLIKKATQRVIIQSQNPHLASIKYAANNNFKRFYQTEIKKRKLFIHPPFAQIIKLIYKDKNEQRCQKQTQKVAEQLKKWSSPNILIIGPYPCFITKRKNFYFWQIVIKLILKNNKLSSKQKDFKKNLPPLINEGFTIDVDPKTII